MARANQVATTVDEPINTVSDNEDCQALIDDVYSDMSDIDLEEDQDYDQALDLVNQAMSNLNVVRDYLTTKV